MLWSLYYLDKIARTIFRLFLLQTEQTQYNKVSTSNVACWLTWKKIMSKKKAAQVVEAQVVEAQVVEATVDQIMNAMVTTKTFKTVKTVKTGVGKQILQLISDGVLSNKEIVAKVLVDNPLRKTTYACVAWYKSQVSAGKIDLPKPLEEVMLTEEELADFGDE